MKRTWFQAQIKQDIAISTQMEHERHSTHKRGSYSTFTKRTHPQAYLSQSYQGHSYTSHEHHKKSHNLTYSISWWAKHMREAHLYGICYKCSKWYKDPNMIWYIKENATCICTWDAQPKLKKAKEHKAYQLPLNTCTRIKEHTKLILSTRDRTKSKRDQVA
jgi:hypothetical protein